jgi:hypothetical protein
MLGTAIRTGIAMAVVSSANVEMVNAQTRFAVSDGEVLPVVDGLRIVTVRDTVLKVCYALFVLEARLPVGRAPSERPNIAMAAEERDRQLSRLTIDFEASVRSLAAGMSTPSPLQYQWEADKARSAYEHQLREQEFARLEDQLAQIASAPQLAVSGPTACLQSPSIPPRSEVP